MMLRMGLKVQRSTANRDVFFTITQGPEQVSSYFESGNEFDKPTSENTLPKKSACYTSISQELWSMPVIPVLKDRDRHMLGDHWSASRGKWQAPISV